VAVVVPKEDRLMAWASGAGVKGSFEELCARPEAAAHILEALAAQAAASGLKGFERVKAVHLDPRELTIERDLVTPTFKLKRPQLQKAFQPQLDALYAAANKR